MRVVYLRKFEQAGVTAGGDITTAVREFITVNCLHVHGMLHFPGSARDESASAN